MNSHVVTSHAVNSHKTSTVWQPYPHVGAAIAPSTPLGMLPQQPSYKSCHLSMGSPQTRMAAFPYQLQRSPEFDMSAADAHIFEQPINYTQSSSYAPSGALMDYNSPVWNPKGWDSMFNTGRAQNGNLYTDPETSLNQSQFAYMLSSQGISADLPQSANSATTTMSSSDNTSGPDRTLPTPTSRGPAPSSSFLPDGTWAPDFKPSASFWNPRQTDSDQRPNSSMVLSNATLTSSPPLQSKYVSIKNNTPDMLFPYLPIPTTTEETNTTSAPTISGNTAYPVLETLGSEYPQIPTRLGRNSRDHSAGEQLLALTNECSPDMYGYSTSEKSKRGRDDSRTLVNGLPYTRVQHRDTPGSAFSFNLGPDSLSEYHRVVENVHRPPVEPLGNQGY